MVYSRLIDSAVKGHLRTVAVASDSCRKYHGGFPVHLSDLIQDTLISEETASDVFYQRTPAGFTAKAGDFCIDQSSSEPSKCR
jgi:hypothetical protein